MTNNKVVEGMNAPPPCFPAGTLVHTDKGLVPIQAIQIGDRVLSKCERTGEQSYKRVTRTFRHDEKTVMFLQIFLKGAHDEATLTNTTIPRDGKDALIVTDNHPFWVSSAGTWRDKPLRQTTGWIPAGELVTGDLLELVDGKSAVVFTVDPTFRTELENRAWVKYTESAERGPLVDLRDNAVHFELGDKHHVEYSDVGCEPWDEDNRFTCTVYNLEVEDFHTYYVGKWGMWVHDRCLDDAH